MSQNGLGRAGLSLERLQGFLLVAEAGGIARAAPQQPVRQSQLSRQIGDLERSLGVELFERSGRSLRLTAAGADLARVVRELARGLEELPADGPLRCALGAGDSVLHWGVLPHAAALTAACPGLTLQLTALAAEDVVQRLMQGQLDLGILRSTEGANELKSLRLGQLEYALFVSRRVSPPRRNASHGDWLAHVPFAAPRGEPGLTRALESLGPVALQCETFPQVASAVRAGGHVGVLPLLARAELPPEAFWCIPAEPLAKAASTLVLAWRPRLDDVRPRLKPLRLALKSAIQAQLER
jgi:DNA-binding transcriptional LysR family regulator